MTSPLHVLPRRSLGRVAALVALTFATFCVAQTTQPAALPADLSAVAPTTQPATLPITLPERPRLVIPPGFIRFDVGDRHFLAEPANEAWIREAVGVVPAATRPSTMPSDLLSLLAAKRPDFIATLVTDLRIDEAAAAKFVDDTLIKLLTGLEAQKTENVAMIATLDGYRALMEGGWSHPAFQYNRMTREVRFASAFIATADVNSVDAVVPFTVNAPDDAATRKSKLAQELANLDENVMRSKAQRGFFLLQASLLKFISEDTLTPRLQLKRPDQEWLISGLTGELTAKYTSLLLNYPRKRVVDVMVMEQRGAPLRMHNLDLLSPPEPASLRREAIPFVLDALRRKSVRAVDQLVVLHGDEVIPKLTQAVQNKMPTDGPALVELIKETTGTDLTPWLRTGQPPPPPSRP